MYGRAIRPTHTAIEMGVDQPPELNIPETSPAVIDSILNRPGEVGQAFIDVGQEIARESSRATTDFDEIETIRRIQRLPQSVGTRRHGGREQRMQLRTRVKVAGLSNVAEFAVVAPSWVMQRQLHEPREGDAPLSFERAPNNRMTRQRRRRGSAGRFPFVVGLIGTPLIRRSHAP